ncbi:hypothetical protein ITI46_06510 [Streptomyces oryzae]|uniref:DUF4232 domain-containing protein n=1 Tax=Streptomyces oryzae TaxID=1434886 RepID=A0ABS3X7I0_9ACTN|nr:hypothetical protein [Streptomyces oryzae]MBO8191345.1 hypothetical protein [Streptomyces oryzae]
MTVHRSRRHRVVLAALVLGLTGALAVTGCSHHSSKKSRRSSSSSVKKSTGSKKSHKRKIIGGGSGSGADHTTRARRSMCRPAPGSFRFIPLSEPSHVLVEYRNKRSSSCTLHNAPVLYRGEDGTKDEPYDRAKPLKFYEGGPELLDGHVLTVAAHGRAYASIPTKTASDKGTAQRLMYFGVMQPHSAELWRTATPLHFGKYDRLPSIGRTAKVGNWYGTKFRAETATDTRPDSAG